MQQSMFIDQNRRILQNQIHEIIHEAKEESDLPVAAPLSQHTFNGGNDDDDNGDSNRPFLDEQETVNDGQDNCA